MFYLHCHKLKMQSVSVSVLYLASLLPIPQPVHTNSSYRLYASLHHRHSPLKHRRIPSPIKDGVAEAPSNSTQQHLPCGLSFCSGHAYYKLTSRSIISMGMPWYSYRNISMRHTTTSHSSRSQFPIFESCLPSCGRNTYTTRSG